MLMIDGTPPENIYRSEAKRQPSRSNRYSAKHVALIMHPQINPAERDESYN
jgi:hypothetical protein